MTENIETKIAKLKPEQGDLLLIQGAAITIPKVQKIVNWLKIQYPGVHLLVAKGQQNIVHIPRDTLKQCLFEFDKQSKLEAVNVNVNKKELHAVGPGDNLANLRNLLRNIQSLLRDQAELQEIKPNVWFALQRRLDMVEELVGKLFSSSGTN